MLASGRELPGLISASGTRHHHVAHLQFQGRQDIGLFPVDVMQQGDAGGAVGIVFDGRHLGLHPQLVALEVDEPVAPFVPPAHVPAGNPAVVVAAAGLLQGPNQALLRGGAGDLGKIQRRLMPPPGGGWLPGNQSHVYILIKLSVDQLSVVSKTYLLFWPLTTGH